MTRLAQRRLALRLALALLLAANLALLRVQRRMRTEIERMPRLGRELPVPSVAAPELGILGRLGASLPERARLALLVFLRADDCVVCLDEVLLWNPDPETLEVLVVASERDSCAVARFLAAEGLRFPLVVDPGGSLAAELGIRAGPEKLLFDAASGALLWRAGPSREAAEQERNARVLWLWAQVAAVGRPGPQ